MLPVYTRVRLRDVPGFHPKALAGEEGQVVGHTEGAYLVKIPYLVRVLECRHDIVEAV